jgi:hypothetical protein
MRVRLGHTPLNFSAPVADAAADTAAADAKAASDKAASDKAATDQAAADKAAGDKAAAEKAAADAAAAKGRAPEGQEPHVPETYTLALPEKSPLTGPDLDRFRGEAKALGLTQVQAQKYVESRNAEVVATIAQLDQDGADLKADPELGGAKWDATLKHTARGLKELFGPDEADAKAFIDRLGLGNNKLLVRALARFGAKFKEDSPVAGAGGGNTEPKTLAERLYGSDKPKA